MIFFEVMNFFASYQIIILWFKLIIIVNFTIIVVI